MSPSFVLEFGNLTEAFASDPAFVPSPDAAEFIVARFPFVLLASGFVEASASPKSFKKIFFVFVDSSGQAVYEIEPADLQELVDAGTEAEAEAVLDGFLNRVLITR